VALLAWAIFGSRLTWLQRVALAAIGAGGAGNLIDRVRFDGAVTDFLNLGLGSLRTGIFNVADTLVMLGALVLLISFRARS
jgi:signal peptidase II